MITVFAVVLVVVSIGSIAFRARLVQSRQKPDNMQISAASIVTIEAAFLRDGEAAVAQVRAAAAQLERDVPGEADPAQIEAALIGRGFVVPRELQDRMNRARDRVLLIIGGVTLAAVVSECVVESGPRRLDRALGLLILAAVAAGANLAIARLPRRTPAGDAALTMRRAAYPPELVAAAHPLEALALYGGRLRRRGKTVAGDDDSCSFEWTAGDASHAHCGGHSSGGHSCGGASCGGH